MGEIQTESAYNSQVRVIPLLNIGCCYFVLYSLSTDIYIYVHNCISTPGAHEQEGYSTWSVCVCILYCVYFVCVCVCINF